ncbi:MAG: hypothetical protein P8177_07485 [Gemmatimonadota bacterium]
MKTLAPTLAAALLATLPAIPVDAQEWQVARERFAFAGSRLEIEVAAPVAGTLRVIRGGPGSVQVAGRAVSGFTAAGLGDERLTLSAAGAGPVDYTVAVPADVWIDVRLPGTSRGESIAGRVRSRAFEWQATGATAEPIAEWLPPLEGGSPRFTTFTRTDAPGVVALPELDHVHSVGIRVEGDRFRVVTSRPLSVDPGDPDVLEIRPAAPPMDLVVSLPAHTARFQLDLGGQAALVIDGDQVRALCAPVTRQELSDGRMWFTFSPVDGALQCGSRSVPRHEG